VEKRVGGEWKRVKKRVEESGRDEKMGYRVEESKMAWKREWTEWKRWDREWTKVAERGSE
jgi:hypothetical protein